MAVASKAVILPLPHAVIQRTAGDPSNAGTITAQEKPVARCNSAPPVHRSSNAYEYRTSDRTGTAASKVMRTRQRAVLSAEVPVVGDNHNLPNR